MRIDRVYVDGFRNLTDVEADFDEGKLTTVIIGQNGSGKSNLLEAIVEIFRHVDLATDGVRFQFEIDYVIRGLKVRIHNRAGASSFAVDGEQIPASKFNASKNIYFPDLVFGYYSGTGRRLEKLFDDHQSRYYSVINKDRNEVDYRQARAERRLFYCRPVHGVFALLSHFAKPGKNGDVSALLNEKLGITGFHSALAHFKEPSWFTNSQWAVERPIKQVSGRRRTYGELGEQALDVWGAKGPAGDCARAFQKAAYRPLAITSKVLDDYRSKSKTEAQLACFIDGSARLSEFSESYESDQDLFAALEAADISDLFREILVWVTREDNDSGDLSFGDLSDGERQLLMVLGLIRVSRGKEAIFLLDEPDTHLNPSWQLSYLDLIKQWTEITAEQDKCQIIMTSHNPLTIAALQRQEVRVMQVDERKKLKVAKPYADPRGMGFTATLTEVFGLSTTLDVETQRQLDERNTLSRIEERTKVQEKQLIEISDKLNRLGFMNESREPLYQDFLRAWHDVRYADRPPLSTEEIEARHDAMKVMIKKLLDGKESAH